MCAHNGKVIELVNLAASVYTENGITLQVPGLAEPVLRTRTAGREHERREDDVRAVYLRSKCYYDAQTSRSFMTSLEIDVNPYTGALRTAARS